MKKLNVFFCFMILMVSSLAIAEQKPINLDCKNAAYTVTVREVHDGQYLYYKIKAFSLFLKQNLYTGTGGIKAGQNGFSITDGFNFTLTVNTSHQFPNGAYEANGNQVGPLACWIR